MKISDSENSYGGNNGFTMLSKDGYLVVSTLVAMGLIFLMIYVFSERFEQQQKDIDELKTITYSLLNQNVDADVLEERVNGISEIVNALAEDNARLREDVESLQKKPPYGYQPKNSILTEEIPYLDISYSIKVIQDTTRYEIEIKNVGSDLYGLAYKSEVSFGEGFPYSSTLKNQESIRFYTYDYGFNSSNRSVFFTFEDKKGVLYKQEWKIKKINNRLRFQFLAPTQLG